MNEKIVIITGDDLEHRFVANEICKRFEVESIFVTSPTKSRSWNSVLKKSFLEFLDKALLRVFLTLIRDSMTREQALTRVFGSENCQNFLRPDKVVRVGRPKSARLLREIEKVSPDIIVVYGTGIVPDSVLSKASKKALNMHTGISPEFRGTACAFWPIYESRPDLVGATVHECVSTVDGGEIYFRAQAPLCRGDGLHSIFARAAKVGAEGYVEVVEMILANSLFGVKQDLSQGREYRGYMRGLRAELIARFKLRGMNKNWPADSRGSGRLRASSK